VILRGASRDCPANRLAIQGERAFPVPFEAGIRHQISGLAAVLHTPDPSRTSTVSGPCHDTNPNNSQAVLAT